MAEMAARDRRGHPGLGRQAGRRAWTGAVWAAVSHGDPIKAILADALGMHLDSFQRILVDPASISIIRYTSARPYVITVNSTDADLGRLLCPPPKRGAAEGAGTGRPGRRRLGRLRHGGGLAPPNARSRSGERDAPR